eukprot:6197428-Pleurochrysis_carterae.AAC.1
MIALDNEAEAAAAAAPVASVPGGSGGGGGSDDLRDVGEVDAEAEAAAAAAPAAASSRKSHAAHETAGAARAGPAPAITIVRRDKLRKTACFEPPLPEPSKKAKKGQKEPALPDEPGVVRLNRDSQPYKRGPYRNMATKKTGSSTAAAAHAAEPVAPPQRAS